MTENTEQPRNSGDMPSLPSSLPSDSNSESSEVEEHGANNGNSTDIRIGSPFAADPSAQVAARPIEPFYDVGPIRYTAMGAVAASIMVFGFSSVAAWWFPSGGALIAALGCVLSIFGLYSAFRNTAISLLTVHLLLFFISYSRSIG